MIGNVPITAIRASLRELAGGADYAYLAPRKARAAEQLILQIMPEVPFYFTFAFNLGMTIVQLGACSDGARMIAFIPHGGIHPAWRGYPKAPRYYATAGYTVRIVEPRFTKSDLTNRQRVVCL